MPENKKFILIEVVERNIHEPAFFDTHEAATREMLDRLKRARHLTDEDVAAAEPCGEGYGSLKHVDDDVYFGEDSAACEYAGENYDWEIFAL